MGFFDRLFGEKAPVASPREILAQAIAEIGHPSLVPKALSLYDDPTPLIEEWSHVQGDLPEWADSARPQSAAELAFQVFDHVMREDERIGFIDWADGWIAIARVFDTLFERSGVKALDDHERADMESRTANCSRGESIISLMKPMHALVEKRGLELTWMHSEQDAHFPIVMQPQTFEKWRKARFGKGVDVLP
jgi:hypothetical protein